MKKKPMKTKRYADGDLVEEDFKKKGLESSKDDRVGFFERLRMGNIDSPNSEAYKRFGAGRGRMDAERAANAAAPNQDISRMGRSEVSSPFLMGRVPMGGSDEAPSSNVPIGLRSAIEGAGVGEGGTAPKFVEKQTTKVSTPRKTVTQTKKSIEKPVNVGTGASGFGIDEEGIEKRRSEGVKAPKTSELRAVTRARTRAGTPVAEDTGKTRAGTTASGSSMAGPMAALAALVGAGALAKRAKQGGSKPIDERAASMGRNPRLMGIDPMMEGDLERMAGEGGPNFKKGGKAKAKPMKKFASGGSVSSASKRGDGIAQKGKTRGRIC